MKIINSIFFILLCLTTYGQEDINKYLSNHHYSFSLDKGFDKKTKDTLKLKLNNYKLILQAEGGSHYLKFYEQLPFMWVKFLNTNFNLKHFFFEFGATGAVCGNKFLETGDTSFLGSGKVRDWQQYFQLNSNLENSNKTKVFGVDFNQPKNYFKSLNILLPKSAPPKTISNIIELIRNGSDSSKDCNYIVKINSQIEKDLLLNTQDYIQFLGTSFKDFKRIATNKGTCKDVFRNRNNNLASNFISYDNDINEKMYYGELGMAHTNLSSKGDAATIINNTPKFKDKVCVISLYCYNCTTEKEKVSNWSLKSIEKDIQKYFLPFCVSDFTLFDLSDNIELTKEYRAFGQYLIIVKDQN